MLLLDSFKPIGVKPPATCFKKINLHMLIAIRPSTPRKHSRGSRCTRALEQARRDANYDNRHLHSIKASHHVGARFLKVSTHVRRASAGDTKLHRLASPVHPALLVELYAYLNIMEVRAWSRNQAALVTTSGLSTHLLWHQS